MEWLSLPADGLWRLGAIGTALGALAVVLIASVPSRAGGAKPVNGTLAYGRCLGEYCFRGWIEFWHLGQSKAGMLTSRPKRGEQRLDSRPIWSPDGRRIAFVRTSPHGSGIYVVGADGRGLRRIVAGPSTLYGWSPDGKKLALDRYGEQEINCQSTNPRLTIADVDGGGTVDISTLPRAAQRLKLDSVEWSPDGRKLLYIVETLEASEQPPGCKGDPFDQKVVYTIGAYGQGKREVVNSTVFAATWSPDGRRIAYVDVMDDDQALSIFVVNADGSGRRMIARDVVAPAEEIVWAPRGDRVMASGDEESRLLATSFDVRSVRRRALARYPARLLGFTRDGRNAALLSNRHRFLRLVPLAGGRSISLGYPPLPAGATLDDVSLHLR